MKSSVLFTKLIPNDKLEEISFIDIHFESFINLEILKLKDEILSKNIIITSKTGAISLLDNFKLDTLKDKDFFVVGSNAKEFLENNNLNVSICVNNAEELVNKLKSYPENNFIYYGSNLKLPTIKKELEKNNQQVREIIGYQTILNPIKINKMFQGIVFFSPSGVESYFISNKISKETLIFAIGKTTKDKIQEYIEVDVFYPKIPDLKNLIQVIKNKFNDKE